jgi:undecaprenyl-diphosphatase
MSEGIVTFLASFAIWLLFAGLILLWVVDGRIKKETALHALASAAFAWVIAEMVKSLIPTLRPFERNGISPLTLTVPVGAAFPSGHTAVAWGLSFAVWLHERRIGWVFLLGAFAVGLGRVWGNVHFPVDVLGGVAIGILVAKIIGRHHFFKAISKN